MTLYMLFPGLGSLIYAGSAPAEAASAAVSGARIALGFQLAYVAALSEFFAAVILLSAKCFPQEPSSSVDRATPSAWRERIVVVAVLLCGGGIAVLIAATGDPGHALACAGPCGAAPDAIVCEDTSATAGRSPSAVVDGELQALAVGITLQAFAGQLTEEQLQALVV